MDADVLKLVLEKMSSTNMKPVVDTMKPYQNRESKCLKIPVV